MKIIVLSTIFACLVAATIAIGCVDDDASLELGCVAMKNFGYCDEYLEFLKGYCDYTCGWCSESDKCVDTTPKAYLDCTQLPSEECNSDKEFYNSRCKKSCNFCGSEVSIAWGEWSQCSVTCGQGKRTRFQMCGLKECEQGKVETGICNLEDCGKALAVWSEWGDWGSCSVTCGEGRKYRTRVCIRGRNCAGKRREEITCELPSCSGDGLQFDRWTPCSRSCDYGTSIKLNRCAAMDLSCPKEYRDCNTFPCRYKLCRSFYRYNGRKTSYSSCCQNTAGTCGKNFFQLSRRVVRGDVSMPKQFPWMVRFDSVRFDTTPEHFCGGTLIHNQFVVTAAHCFELIRDLQDITAVLGSISRADRSSYVQRIGIDSVVSHPNYSFPENDIAIVKLKKPVVISDYVRIICLPNGEDTPPDAKCFIAGWGYRHFLDQTVSPLLMEASAGNLPFGFCKKVFPRSAKDMDEASMMCAGRISGEIDTCEGDSGGPLMCQRCSSCSWYLAGVTSFGSRTCGVGKTAGVYSRVKYFEDWIATIVTPAEKATYTCPS